MTSMNKIAASRSLPRCASRPLLPLLLAVSLAACSGKTAEPSTELPLVTVLAPGLSDVISSVEFTGTINARDETALPRAQRPARPDGCRLKRRSGAGGAAPLA